MPFFHGASWFFIHLAPGKKCPLSRSSDHYVIILHNDMQILHQTNQQHKNFREHECEVASEPKPKHDERVYSLERELRNHLSRKPQKCLNIRR